jgi:hypothetical protein
MGVPIGGSAVSRRMQRPANAYFNPAMVKVPHADRAPCAGKRPVSPHFYCSALKTSRI